MSGSPSDNGPSKQYSSCRTLSLITAYLKHFDPVTNLLDKLEEKNRNVQHLRDVIFKPELYDSVMVTSLMQAPMTSATMDDTMEDIVLKFQKTAQFNIVVLKEGKYVGFVSRAAVFSKYRLMLKEFSED